MLAAAQKIDRQQIKKLTDSMDGRLITTIEKNGGYTGHYILFWKCKKCLSENFELFVISTVTDENKQVRWENFLFHLVA